MFKKLIYSLLFIASHTDIFTQETYLYSTSDGGRLGDRLLLYIKAEWISYNTGLPLALNSCKYFDDLLIFDDKNFLEKLPKDSKKTILDRIPKELEAINNLYYIIRYYPPLSVEMLEEIKNDKKFIEQIKQTIVPKKQLSLISPPKGAISLAVHIRKGEGYDLPLKSCQYFSIEEVCTKRVEVREKTYVDWYHPLKFPPEQYYVDQIKRLSSHFDNAPIYLFIFTDHPNPQMILERVKNEVNLPNITFDCRKTGAEEKDVLIDFFSMMNFDCLVRAGNSYFSLISELLCDHRLVVFPKSSHWEKDKENRYYLLMDDIQFEWK